MAGATWMEGTPGIQKEISYSRPGPNSTLVIVSGINEMEGIYFIPFNTTVQGLFNITGFKRHVDLQQPAFLNTIKDKTRIRLGRSGSHAYKITSAGPIDSITRLALSYPLEINRATLNDLLMVPGIGEKVARQII
jgi:DNA uptake protein ComE-like DNA-binding protein